MLVLIYEILNLKYYFNVISRLTIMVISTITLASCAPDLISITSLGNCDVNDKITPSKLEVLKNRYTFTSTSSGYRNFDLINNKFTCDQYNPEAPLHAFTNGEAQVVYEAAIEITNGNQKVNIHQSAQTKQTALQFAEKMCRDIGFSFLFGIDDPDDMIIGCQLSEAVTSAIMFKKGKSDGVGPVTIAALPLYTPIIKKYMNAE